jgi:hypothetical protein
MFFGELTVLVPFFIMKYRERKARGEALMAEGGVK